MDATPLLVISDCHPRDVLFLRPVLEAFPGAPLLRPDYAPAADEPAPSRRRQRGARYRDLRERARRWYLGRRTSGAGGVPIDRRARVEKVPWRHFRDGRAAERIAAHDPAVVLVCRAPILGPAVLAAARRCAVNAHFGVPPAYRGNDTIFWALVDRRYEHVGGVLHHLDAGIDTGSVVAEYYPRLAPGDLEPSIELRVAEGLGRLAVEYVRHVVAGGDPRGATQPAGGRTFRSVQRGAMADLRYVLAHGLRLARLPRRDERVVRHFDREG